VHTVTLVHECLSPKVGGKTLGVLSTSKSRGNVPCPPVDLGPWRWPLTCLTGALAALSLQASRYLSEVSGHSHVRSPHLWCGRKVCGSGMARVTIVHALQMQCRAKVERF